MPKKLHITLTDAAERELARVKSETGYSSREIFQHGFTLLRIYLEAKESGESVYIGTDSELRSVVILPPCGKEPTQ